MNNTRKYQKRISRKTAAMLSLFFGGFAAQKIYLRQRGLSFVMISILFVTSMAMFPFFAIFGVFEAVRLFSMSDDQFDRKYNRYAFKNRRDDYLERRRERQVNKSRSRSTRRRGKETPRRSSILKANPFKNSGIKKYKDYDLEGAIEDFSQGLNINPGDVALHFNIANAYSMTEEKDKAYYHLAKAVELGFKDFEKIKTKDDLAYVRIQPEFDEFVANGYKLGTTSARRNTVRTQQKEEDLVITDDVLLSQLNKLAELRKKGLLSQEEFSMERKKLLRR